MTTIEHRHAGDELAWLDAAALTAAYRTGELSPVDVAEACLARIERVDPALNAFCVVDPESALDAARAAEARWRKGQPLSAIDGVPLSIKDLMLARGWPTLRGSRTVDPAGPWTEDSPPAARVREAGAVLIGKTTTPEFAWKGVTDSPLTGVTRNPWHRERTPGGSSGGAAAAVAAGLGPLAIGTDAGGSLRIPASFSGVYTIKPSGGRVPTWPPTPYGTFASTGPITRTVGDAARLLAVLARPDPRDWAALPPDDTAYAARLDEPQPRPLVAAWSPTLGYGNVAPPVRAACERAVAALADAGVRVEEVDEVFPDPAWIMDDLKRALTRLAFKHLDDDKLALMDPDLAEAIRDSRSAELMPFLEADRARTALGQRLCEFHQSYDLLLTPAVAVTAFAVARRWPDSHPHQWRWSPFCYPFNLTRQPAASVPCGFDGDGLPIGLQIVGPPHRDLLVLQASRLLETIRPWADRRPPEPPPADGASQGRRA